MQKPSIAAPAPLFKLLNQAGEPVALESFRGHKAVVLYFYPKAMTPGCTTQACGLRDSQAAYAAQDLVVLGLSPDTPERLQKFASKENLNFDLLSDPEHQVAEQYGVWGPKKFMGRTFDGIHRTTFIIGKDGLLKQIFAKVKTKSHHSDVLDWLAQHPEALKA